MKINNFLLISLVAIFLVNCKSTRKLTEIGNYDEAIKKSINKLAGKKKKKAETVATLELAFEKANSRDINEINTLKAANLPKNWERIFDLATAIQNRQTSVEPLLPLVDDRGKKASFKFLKINTLVQESKNKATNYLYDQGQQLLTKARRGDKTAARSAYENLDRIARYVSSYKDRLSLMSEARSLGVSHILFRMENKGFALLSRDFERAILEMDVQDMNELWREFHTRENRDIQYDYEIVMRLDDIDVSPESIREREFREEKEIEEGEKILRDQNGNVVKDSLGNVVKVPDVKIVSANIIEVYQSKSAIVGGSLYFFDKIRNELLDNQPIAAEVLFENYAATYQGDRRALSNESKNIIGNEPLPFPPDAAMLLDAADILKPIIKEKISETRFF